MPEIHICHACYRVLESHTGCRFANGNRYCLNRCAPGWPEDELDRVGRELRKAMAKREGWS